MTDSQNTIDTLFKAIQNACPIGIWSQGISFARNRSVMEDSSKPDEIILRIMLPNRPVSPKVTLWPEDLDWHCDCGSREDPCSHVAAAIIAVKNNELREQTNSIVYRFQRAEGTLLFSRWMKGPKGETELIGSLVSQIGGTHSGRIKSSITVATKADYAVENALGNFKKGVLEREIMTKLIISLENCTNIEIDGHPIKACSRPMGITATVSDSDQGFILIGLRDAAITEIFRNGAVLCGNELHPTAQIDLTDHEKSLLNGEPHYFDRNNIDILVSDIIPSLRKKIPLQILTSRLPKIDKSIPRIVLKADTIDNTTLSVTPILIYGNPPIAEIHSDKLHSIIADILPERDKAAEKLLLHKLRSELNLQLDQHVIFKGEAAVSFSSRIKSWDVLGDNFNNFLPIDLIPKIKIDNGVFDLYFASNISGRGNNKADSVASLKAWRENIFFVPLIEGGWGKLPIDWLNKYGDTISRFIAAKDDKGRLPPWLVPSALDFCFETDQAVPENLQSLKYLLNNFDHIPSQEPPTGLKADLRLYQKQGINWLCFMRDNKLGALLADDMGLGKTLQALCVIRGRTLIITPTSVLGSWADQIEQFRPDLNFQIYHGSKRTIDRSIKVTITSYAILRLDQVKLCSEEWDTVILDESQFIKNPESLVANAVYNLQSSFRFALTGTPVENRLDDLWSQFRFLNPGLLGGLEYFRENYTRPIAFGNKQASEKLRKLIKPFILRRLKTDVMSELPPRIETVIQCELNEQEIDVYKALLISNKAEVIRHLESGGSVFAALELLLRLRQTCCHLSLVPGHNAESSSKIELLKETLADSLQSGHKALVFSQWTSLLDLIEPHLKAMQIAYLRLDGSTINRDYIIKSFQNESGPPVLLISLKAGGYGLTLTAADHVFLMDPWWNPSVEDQAADRTHRIGQKRAVLIHKIITTGTIEEGILRLQKKKQQIASSVLQGTESAFALTREDLMELLDENKNEQENS